MNVNLILGVHCRTVIRHRVAGLETEHLGRGGAGHAELLNDRLILPASQARVINISLPTTPRHIRLEMIRIDKILTFYSQLRQC